MKINLYSHAGGEFVDYSDVKDMDRLTLTNSITISALVGLLVKKGILTEEEMVKEVKRLRAKIEGQS
ncbi:hypothetical protein ACFLU6_03690 [Acidobacteriota bacterium]